MQLEHATVLHASGDYKGAITLALAAVEVFGATDAATSVSTPISAAEQARAAQNRDISRKNQLVASRLMALCHDKRGEYTANRLQLEDAEGHAGELGFQTEEAAALLDLSTLYEKVLSLFFSEVAWRWSCFVPLGLEMPGFVPEILQMDVLWNGLC